MSYSDEFSTCKRCGATITSKQSASNVKGAGFFDMESSGLCSICYNTKLSEVRQEKAEIEAEKQREKEQKKEEKVQRKFRYEQLESQIKSNEESIMNDGAKFKLTRSQWVRWKGEAEKANGIGGKIIYWTIAITFVSMAACVEGMFELGKYAYKKKLQAPFEPIIEKIFDDKKNLPTAYALCLFYGYAGLHWKYLGSNGKFLGSAFSLNGLFFGWFKDIKLLSGWMSCFKGDDLKDIEEIKKKEIAKQVRNLVILLIACTALIVGIFIAMVVFK